MSKARYAELKKQVESMSEAEFDAHVQSWTDQDSEIWDREQAAESRKLERERAKSEPCEECGDLPADCECESED